MSYEGIVEVLCKTGHYFAFDCWDAPGIGWSCPVCGESIAVSHSVDETNGADEDDYLQKEAILPTRCADCGGHHILPPTFKAVVKRLPIVDKT